MEYIIVFAVAFLLGMVYATRIHINNIKKIAEEHGMDLDTMVMSVANTDHKTIPVLVTENLGNVIYLYEKDTNNFVCQGSTITELADKSLKFKNIPVALVEHDNATIWFYNGEVKQRPEIA